MQPQLEQSGVSAELARRDARRQIGGDRRRRAREHAFVRRSRRVRRRRRSGPSAPRASDSGAAAPSDRATTRCAVGGRQPLVRDLADLRRVEADPDLPRLLPRRPEPQELLEIAGPVDLLPRDRAVHDDLVPDDVLQDAIVGGRRPARRRARAAGRRSTRRSSAAEWSPTPSGISRTALVTSCAWMPRFDSSGSSAFSSL